MKKIYLITLLGMACHVSNAQTEMAITYEYDAAGNRTVRKQAGSLPVTLVSFSVEKINHTESQRSAHLKWRTSFETNSDYFEIQRSGEGKNWVNIGLVQANGEKSSDTDYSFIDEQPLDGENVYRLKMVDKDDTFAFSRLQSLHFEAVIVLYPSPTKDRLFIKGIADAEHVTQVSVWDTGGRLVRNLSTIPAQGIDLSKLPTGIYTIRIISSKGIIIQSKILKE